MQTTGVDSFSLSIHERKYIDQPRDFRAHVSKSHETKATQING